MTKSYKSRIKNLLFPVFCLLLSIFVVFGLIRYLSAQLRNNYHTNFKDKEVLPQGDTFSPLRTPLPRTDYKFGNIIKDDWLVNDDTLGGCDQLEPSITSTKTGYIVVWMDYRNGHDPDIYAGRFDFNGVPIGSAIRVNDDTGDSYQGVPSVDADSAGNFVVVWEDKRIGETDIYGQRYNQNAMPIGSNFRVNDDAGGREQYTPVVAMGLGGKFIVAWRDDRNSAPDIYAQIYDAGGSPIGNNFIVNDDGSWNAFQVFPDVANTPNNEFAVVWLDTRAGLGIYCQRYTSLGAPIGSNFKVTDNPDSTTPMRFPSIRSNLANQTVIVWRDHRVHDSYPNVYSQRYDFLWNSYGANFRVNGDTAYAWHDVPSVAVDSAGNFVVVWSDGRQDFYNPDAYGQCYDAMGNPQGTNFKINELSAGKQEFTAPVVSLSPAGDFITVWQDNSGLKHKLLAQRCTQTGTPVGNNFSLIMDKGFSNQKAPEIVMNEHSNFVIAWEDERSHNLGIFVQRYDTVGNPLGVNQQVTDTSKTASSPSVAIDSACNFTIVWSYATPSHTSHIYGCKYTSEGSPVTSEFQVNSLGPDALRDAPSVAMDRMGNFVVVWEDYRNDTKYCNIYAQRYKADCTPIDSNFIIDQSAGESSEFPCVVMDSDGNFIVVWQEGRAGMPLFDIYGQRFDSSGTPVGTNFQISDAPMAQHQQIYPSVTLHRDGNFVVVWQDTRDHTEEIYDIYAQIYDVNGLPVGANFKVNDDIDSISHEFPSVILHPDTKEFMVIWTDYRMANPQIMAQKFDSSGVSVGNNFQINNSDVHSCNYHLSSSRSGASNGERVAIAWMDNRRLKGWDIYAKLVKWKFMKAEDVDVRVSLFKIYPNPTFKKLTVKYTIPSCTGKSMTYPYTILLYDIAGRISTEFILPERAPGVYTTQIDISTFSSGIYFLKFKGPHITPISEKVIVCH